jgi:pimeloyl-ACP methyl ester carboxylesterase
VTSSPTLLGADRAGSGDALLLLHGIGTTRADFARLLPRLAEHYDVLAVDLPGHGGSPALECRHTVAALAGAVDADLEARGLGPVHVLGNSLGGRIALELARFGRARSVVALAPSGMGWPAERLYQASALVSARLAMSTIRPLVPVLARQRAGRAGLLAALRARPWAASEQEALALRDGLADSERFWDTLWWTVMADLPAGISHIGCPLTLVQGALDWIAPGQAARYLAALPEARFEPLLLAGHAPQGDRPAEIVRIVRATTRNAPAVA